MFAANFDYKPKTHFMKKILLVVLIAATAFSSQAQVKFGVKAGANFYKFTGDDADLGTVSPDFRVGLAAGGYATIPISEMFSFQPELLYSMEGSKYEEAGDELIYKIDYINIPALFQFNSSGFYAETGPQIGFRMNAEGEYNGTSTDLDDEIKSTNFSWVLGAGYRLPNGLGFGARYNLGLSSIAEDSDTDLKTSGFHIGVSFSFGGK